MALYFFGQNYFKYDTAQPLRSTTGPPPTGLTPPPICRRPITSASCRAPGPAAKFPLDGPSSFVVKGSNALQGSQAAYALEEMMKSPNIPAPPSQTFTFEIAYPEFTINPVGTHYMGVPFTVFGTMNLATGDTLQVAVTNFTFWPMGKEEANADVSSP